MASFLAEHAKPLVLLTFNISVFLLLVPVLTMINNAWVSIVMLHSFICSFFSFIFVAVLLVKWCLIFKLINYNVTSYSNMFCLKRRLRIRTLQYRPAKNINEIYDSVDPETLLHILVHKVTMFSFLEIIPLHFKMFGSLRRKIFMVHSVTLLHDMLSGLEM